MKLQTYVIFVSIILTLIGCTKSEEASTIVSPTVVPTPSATATVTLTPTLSSTATPHPPTPNFFDSQVAEDFLFATPDDPDCPLPCWQGLRVGKSDRQDIQAMFDTVFGFNGTVDFFDPDQISLSPLVVEIPSVEATGHYWDFEYGRFGVYMAVDQQGILQGIEFTHVFLGSHDVGIRTTQKIIENLGTPLYVYTALQKIETRDQKVAIKLLLAYAEGLTLFSYYEFPVRERIPGSTNDRYVQFCLDTPVSTGSDYITAPFDTLDESNLDLVQKAWIAPFVARLTPFEEAFEFSIGELVSIALQHASPCVDLNYDLFDY